MGFCVCHGEPNSRLVVHTKVIIISILIFLLIASHSTGREKEWAGTVPMVLEDAMVDVPVLSIRDLADEDTVPIIYNSFLSL